MAEDKPPIQINLATPSDGGKIIVTRKGDDQIEISYNGNGHKPKKKSKRFPPSAGKGPEWFVNRKRSLNFNSHDWCSMNGNWLDIKCSHCDRSPDELGFWKSNDGIGKPCHCKAGKHEKR